MLFKESKEKLPADFITQFVSRGWEEIGNLKASIECIKKEFKDASKTATILQDLLDAYLLAVGQLELQLDDKFDLSRKEAIKESLVEGAMADEHFPLKGLKDMDIEKPVKPQRANFKDVAAYTAASRQYDLDLAKYNRLTERNWLRKRYYLDLLGELNNNGWSDIPNKDFNIIINNFEGYCDHVGNHKHTPIKGQGFGKTEDDLRGMPSGTPGETRIYVAGANLSAWPDGIPAPNGCTIKSYKSEDDAKEAEHIAKARAKGLSQDNTTESLAESSPELAEPIEAKKFETEKCVDGKCCKKTEVFTELPDYDVEVEQKGDKIEIELEPKDSINSESNVVDKDVEMINNQDINDMAVGNPVVGNNANQADQEFNAFDVDFADPEPDEEADNEIRRWLEK